MFINQLAIYIIFVISVAVVIQVLIVSEYQWCLIVISPVNAACLAADAVDLYLFNIVA